MNLILGEWSIVIVLATIAMMIACLALVDRRRRPDGDRSIHVTLLTGFISVIVAVGSNNFGAERDRRNNEARMSELERKIQADRQQREAELRVQQEQHEKSWRNALTRQHDDFLSSLESQNDAVVASLNRLAWMFERDANLKAAAARSAVYSQAAQSWKSVLAAYDLDTAASAERLQMSEYDLDRTRAESLRIAVRENYALAPSMRMWASDAVRASFDRVAKAMNAMVRGEKDAPGDLAGVVTACVETMGSDVAPLLFVAPSDTSHLQPLVSSNPSRNRE